MVKVHKIPPELIINWDQTPISVAPTTNRTMAEVGSKRVEVATLKIERWHPVFTNTTYGTPITIGLMEIL